MTAFNVVLGCAMALFIVLVTMSSMARYYVKFTIFVVLSLIFATAPLPLMLLKPFDPRNALIPAWFLRVTSRMLGMRWTVRGLENIDNSRGAVLLLNHQTGLDLYGNVGAVLLLNHQTGLDLYGNVCPVRYQRVLRVTSRMLGMRWTVRGLENIDNSRGAVLLLNHQTGLDLYGNVCPVRYQRVLRVTSRMQWTVRGLENIDSSRGAVLLLNHQTGLDLYALAVLWPLMERCTVVSKRSLQYLVPFGTAAWMWGTVFIDRGAQSAREALNKQTVAVRDNKRKLLLFPEGTRHSGDKLLPFRKGAFHVALNAEAPIQPVVVSKYHFLDHKRRRFGSAGRRLQVPLPRPQAAEIRIRYWLVIFQLLLFSEGTRHSGDKLLPFRKGEFHVALNAEIRIRYWLVIFQLLPLSEGTRHSSDKLLPFRKGAFHVALNAEAPIQPVVVSKYHFLDHTRRRFGSGTG
ncbi:acyltransferase domain-containing protein [Phthorimaea operculella]|nr:acyltransferase domain-containing protein [Phthorimaea operculella]